MRCLCKLKVIPAEINLSCPWHGHLKVEGPVYLGPRGLNVITYSELVQQLTALEMDHDTVKTFAENARETLKALAFNTTVFIENRTQTAGQAILEHIGRWRCPVCNHWVDEKGGWRIFREEEICGRCYLILKGGEPEEQGDDQWLPR